MTTREQKLQKVTWLDDPERPDLGITHGIVDGKFYTVASKGNTPGIALVHCAEPFKKMRQLNTKSLPDDVELVQVI